MSAGNTWCVLFGMCASPKSATTQNLAEKSMIVGAVSIAAAGDEENRGPT